MRAARFTDDDNRSRTRRVRIGNQRFVIADVGHVVRTRPLADGIVDGLALGLQACFGGNLPAARQRINVLSQRANDQNLLTFQRLLVLVLHQRDRLFRGFHCLLIMLFAADNLRNFVCVGVGVLEHAQPELRQQQTAAAIRQQ